MIIWAGTSSKDVGMVIEHYPGVIIPQKNVETQHVPGRSDDILLPDGSYQNYTQNYQAFLDAKNLGGLEAVMPKITDWLLGHEGYQRLEDSYFPDVYRMACYMGGNEFISMFNEYGEGTLSFNCAPEKFYKIGDEPVSMTQNKKLFNKSAFPANPIIELTGNGSNGALYFNGVGFGINSVPSNLTIDVKQHRAYNGSTSYSSRITGAYENLVLGKETTVSWSGGITSVKIRPRWWTI